MEEAEVLDIGIHKCYLNTDARCETLKLKFHLIGTIVIQPLEMSMKGRNK